MPAQLVSAKDEVLHDLIICAIKYRNHRRACSGAADWIFRKIESHMRLRHFARLLALLLGGMTPAGAAVNLSYVDLGAGGNACCLVPDGLGNVYVIGSVARANGANVSVTRLDATN